jgi:hypothetical protein
LETYNNIQSLLIVLVLLFIFDMNIAQFREIEQMEYHNYRLRHPVKVKVLSHRNKLTFYAENKSYYPYRLTLRFKALNNLYPNISEREFTIQYGRTNLMSFTIMDVNKPPYYAYEMKYRIKQSDDKINTNFPYLIPVGEKMNMKSYIVSNSGRYIRNSFRMDPGDTIFAMRKGLIVAQPNTRQEIDKLSPNEAIEISHLDGTVMLYWDINPNQVFVSAGETVFPGQPIGLIKNNRLFIQLYQIRQNESVKLLNIKYINDCKQDPQTFENILNCYSIYPSDIIKLEMYKSEKRKYDKHKLY